VDAALGTDTAGSVRIPAAFCGVTGVRPSSGLVSNRGVVPVAWTLDTVGPLARTAEECGRLLEIMAGKPLPARDGDLRIGAVTSLFEQARRCRPPAGSRRRARPAISQHPAPARLRRSRS
jgi:Asp-tRNA(Asn)/Glu-tRNA(Gln) amidotransferase A subunit family amidase